MGSDIVVLGVRRDSWLLHYVRFWHLADTFQSFSDVPSIPMYGPIVRYNIRPDRAHGHRRHHKKRKSTAAATAGTLTFAAEINPEQVEVCNCMNHPTFSGSAFRGFDSALEGTFKLLFREPKRYLKTAASGHVNAMVFCPNCGTHIRSTDADVPVADLETVMFACH